MNYNDYTLEDFLNDDYFIEWVTNPSPECDYFWKNWISKNPKNTKIIFLAREMVTSLTYRNNFQPTDDEKVEVLENIIKKKTNKETAFKIGRILKFAAAAVIVLGFSLWLSLKENAETARPPVEMVMKQTSYGEKKNIALPDGTEIKLNYGSQLTFPKNFNSDVRKVTLSGEAFFDVKPNPDKPFVITTKDVQTIVLGTSFNVKAYSDEDEIRVIVATGKVRVQNQVDQNKLEDVILLPNEMVSLNKMTGRVVKEKCNPTMHLAWKEGILIFRKATFEEVVNKLEKWYGVGIQIGKGVQIQGRFNGEFHNKSLENVLKGFSFSNQIGFQLHGKTVTLSKNEEN